GALSQAEVSRLQLRVGRSESRQLDIAGQLALAKLRLGAMWGRSEPLPELPGDLTLLPDIPQAQSLSQAVDETPAFLRLQTDRRLAAAELRLQQAGNRAD